jgi:hypothetical protein
MNDIVIGNFCRTCHLSWDDVAGIMARLKAGLSGVRFPAKARDFATKRPYRPGSLPTFVFIVLHMLFPHFPRDKVVKNFGWVKLSAGHSLMLRLRMIMSVPQVPHLPALTFVTSLNISLLDFTSETYGVTYMKSWLCNMKWK